MNILQFDDDITIDKILDDYKKEIYESILKAIKENYKNNEINEINVVKIITQSKDYSIKLPKDKFIMTLNHCINFFIGLEMYENCQECHNIIKEIEEKITA